MTDEEDREPDLDVIEETGQASREHILWMARELIWQREQAKASQVTVVRMGLDPVPPVLGAAMAAKLDAVSLAAANADRIAGGLPGSGRGLLKAASIWDALNVRAEDYERIHGELDRLMGLIVDAPTSTGPRVIERAGRPPKEEPSV
jgi:hypothetical protein